MQAEAEAEAEAEAPGPTRTAESLRRDALLLAEQRDPFGHLLHTCMGMVALFLAPLGIVPAEVGFWMLVAVSALRAWTLGPAWAGVLRWPCTKWLLALVAFAALSLAWSPDPGEGIARMKFLRATLWAFLLWPVLGDPWARPRLLLALLLGIAALAATQIAGSALPQLGLPARAQWGIGGLHGEPSKAALWCAAGLCVATGLLSQARMPKPRAAGILVLGALASTGLVMSGSLRVIGATGVSLAACGAAALVVSRATRKWGAIAIAGAAALVIGAWMFAPGLVARARTELQLPLAGPATGATQSGVPTEAQLRAFWWEAEWHGFMSRPTLGWGWGSTPAIVAAAPNRAQFASRYPDLASSQPNALSPSQPHSLYLMCLGELGLIGTALLTVTLGHAARGAVEAVRANPVHAGAAAGLAMWLLAAAGDTVTNSNALALGTMMVTLALAPDPVRRRSKSELSAATNGRIRVAVFVEKFGMPGGSERFAQETVCRMADSGRFEFHVFANRWNCTRQDITFYRVPMVRFPRPLRPWLFVHLAQRMINSGQFDVVHSHHAYPGADIVSLHGTPRRFWVERIQGRRPGLFDRVCDSVDRSMLRSGGRTHFMPVSSLVTQTYRVALGELPGRWSLLHPGVDNARFGGMPHARSAHRQRLGIKDDELVLLFVGLNYDIKGLQLIMEGLALARPRMGASRLRLLVVGRGDDARYAERARQLGISDCVTFAGVVESGLESYYQSADAFAMLSLYETFCMAVLEAMAAGLPVIITDRMGICDLVRDGEQGFVLPHDADAEQVAECIVRLPDASLRSALGRHGRMVAETHDWSAVAARLAGAYEESATAGRA